ncbi:MAG: leucyl aminopeptidase family protein [Rhodospirillaceae bacterium]|nr:leucyl aminopeptidase family protein [Rhodospirillaceae bacterium]
MIRICFADRDNTAPWGNTPLGAADAWITGHRTSNPSPRGSLARPMGLMQTLTSGDVCTLSPSTASICGWTGATELPSVAALTESAAERLGQHIGAAIIRPGIRRVFIDADLFPGIAAALASGLVLRAEPRLCHKSRHDTPFDDATACPEEVVIITTNPTRATNAWTEREPATRATIWARHLIDTPANHLTPAALQAEAETLIPLGVRVTTLDATALAAQGMNLLLSVGHGASQPPRLIILDWPGSDETAAPLALIGKGITFDTGGISLKPAEHMEDMKGDMGGAAAVLGALRAAATRRSPMHIVGLLAVAENAVSGRAARPGDVVMACDGSSVEIVDTDAEGRLVLADALAHARNAFAPFLMVDLATLTGAVARTLGAWHGGLFANQDDAATRLECAAQTSGEALWRLPLPSESSLDEALKSDIADLKNCAWGVAPDALHAAGFLSRFAGDTPWAHLDIAGVADAPKDTARERAGPRGFGVRLLDALIRDLETTPWPSTSML